MGPKGRFDPRVGGLLFARRTAGPDAGVSCFLRFSKANPTYREVCSGSTGHVEVLQVKMSPQCSYEALLRFFYQFHDPTTLNRQEGDVGTQVGQGWRRGLGQRWNGPD